MKLFKIAKLHENKQDSFQMPFLEEHKYQINQTLVSAIVRFGNSKGVRSF